LLGSLPQEQITEHDAALKPAIRHLVVILGDQLNRDASAWDGFDKTRDRVWMCEARDESTHVMSAKQRIVVFLSAMRHFAQALREDAVTVDYREMAVVTLAEALAETLARCASKALC
jgi:deoxyribodipyrimidine photolyase-related protein